MYLVPFLTMPYELQSHNRSHELLRHGIPEQGKCLGVLVEFPDPQNLTALIKKYLNESY